MYVEIKGDIGPIVTLYKLAKAQGMNPQHVTKFLTFVTSDLQGTQFMYEGLKQEVSSLKEQRRDLNNEVTKLNIVVAENGNVLVNSIPYHLFNNH